MKKQLRLGGCLLVLGLLVGCNDKVTPIASEAITVAAEAVGGYEESNPEGILVDFDAEIPIGTYYALDESLAYHQGADLNSKVLGYYAKGAELEVLEEQEQWLVVRERISRDLMEEGQEINRTAWEKVFVLKSATSQNPFINVSDDELYSTSDTDPNTRPDKILEMGWLRPKEFEVAYSKHRSQFKADTLRFVKQNQQYDLKFETCERVLSDVESEDEIYAYYEFTGSFEKLHKSVFNVRLYEGHQYILVDEKDCSIADDWVFSDRPILNSKGTVFATIGYDPYMDETNIQVIPLNGRVLGERSVLTVDKWTVWETEKYKMFWVDDQTFYVPILHIRTLTNMRNNIADVEAEKHLQFLFCRLK